MALEFMNDDIMAMFTFMSGTGKGKEAVKETAKYNKALDDTSSKLNKVLKEMKHLEDESNAFNKTLEKQSKEASDNEKEQKKLNKVYVAQANALDKLRKKNARRKNVIDNTKQIKSAEKELNAVLKQRKKIESDLEKIQKSKIATQSKLNANMLKSEKLSIDKGSLSRRKDSLMGMSGGDKGKDINFLKTAMDGIKAYSNIAFAIRTTIAPLADSITKLAEIEKKITALGVVSNKSSYEIKGLRTQLMAMSTEGIYSASQLSESMEQIVRTGKNLDDAFNIVGETVNLATATFESLSFATMTVNKAMVALKIDSQDASKVVNAFHNIVLSTPLDLRTLDESLRQTASAFGTVVEFSGRSGEDLNEYKIQVLNTVSALTGAMALMGKTGSQAGTSLKMFGTKLLAMTPAAGNRLDAEMKSKGANISMTAMNALGMSPEQIEKGVNMSTTLLTRLVKKDLDVALNEVSRLYQTGALSFETLAKMFGQRHVGQIATMLTMVGGDIGDFKNQLLSMRNVTEDSEIALGSWAASLDKAGNSFTRLQGTMMTFLDTTGKASLDYFSDLLNSMSRVSEETPGLISGLFAGTGAMMAAVVAGKKVTDIFTKYTLAAKAANLATAAGAAQVSAGGLALGSLLNPYMLAAVSVAALIGMWVADTARLNTLERERVANAIELDNIYSKSAHNLFNLQSTKLKIQKSINGQLAIESNHWENITGFIKQGNEAASKFYGGMTIQEMTLSDSSSAGKGSLKDRVEMDYIMIQEKRIALLKDQEKTETDAYKLEVRKLALAKKAVSTGSAVSGMGGLMSLKTEREIISRTSKSGEEVEERNAKLDASRIIYRKEFMEEMKDPKFESLTKSYGKDKKGKPIKPVVDKEELARQLQTMDTLEISTFYTEKINGLKKKVLAGHNVATQADKDMLYLYSKQQTDLQVLIDQVSGTKQTLGEGAIVEEELQEAKNKANAKFLENFQEDMNRLNRFQGVINANMTKIQNSMLNKKNIQNVEDMYTAMSEIGGKGTGSAIKAMLSEVTVDEKRISESDIMRATKGGKDLSILQESASSKKIIDAQVANVLAKKQSLIGYGIDAKGLEESKKDFLGAKTEKARQAVLDSMYTQIKAGDDRTNAIKADMDLFLNSARAEDSVRKEYIAKMRLRLMITETQIEASDIVFRKSLEDEKIHITAMSNAKTEALKLQEQSNETERNRVIEQGKLRLAEASQSKEKEALFKMYKGGLFEAEVGKTDLGVDFSTAESFSSSITSIFENPEEVKDLLGKKMPEGLRDAIKKLFASTKRKEDIEIALANLDNEDIKTRRENIDLRTRLNLSLIDRVGKQAKNQLRARQSVTSGTFGGFDKVKEFEALKLDKSIVDNKIAYLNSLDSTIEIRKQVADLEQKSFELELEQYEKKKGAIRDVSNMGLSMIVDAATTGEMPRVDNAQLMSGFGDLMATFMGGDAPDVPESTLAVAEDSLTQLKIIAKKIDPSVSATEDAKGGADKVAQETIKDKLLSITGDATAGFGEKFSSAEGWGAKFDVAKGAAGDMFTGFKDKWTGTKMVDGKKTAVKGKFTSEQKTEMAVQAAGASLGIINSFTQAKADNEVKSLKVEEQVLEARLQGAETEEEKAALEEQIYQNKKKQIKAEYKSKTQFMGMSGSTGAALGGAAKGAMAGAAGGPMGMAAGAGMGLISGWMGGNKAKADMKQQLAALKVQKDIKQLNEDRNKMLKANNTFMGTFSKYAGKIGIEEGMNAAFKSIRDTGTMAIGGAGIETWSKSHGSGKGKYKTQESIQKTVGLSDIGMTRDTFDSLADTELAILKTEEKLAYYRKGWSHDAKASAKAYANMLKNLKSIADIHKSNISIYKSYFGAKLTEEKEGERITGYSADWNDFRAEILKMSSSQALSGMDADIQKFTKNFFDGVTDAFVQNSSDLNNIISKSVIPAYELMANVLNNEYDNMDKFNDAYTEALDKANSSQETSKKHVLNNEQIRMSMELLVLASKQYKEEQDLVNKEVGKFEKTWVSAGGKISDILDSATQGTKDLYSSLMASVTSGGKSGLEALIGSDIIKSIGEANMKDALDGLSMQIVNISKAATDGKATFGDFSKALEDYLVMSDALGDFERYKDELKSLGMSDEEIAKLEYQLKLQDLLNDKLEERMNLSDLLSMKQSDLDKEIQGMITEISKAGGYDKVDQIVKDRYQELLKELQDTKGELKDATREFTKGWLDGTIDGVFDEVKSGLDENTTDLFDSVQSAFSQDSFADMGSEVGSSIAQSILGSYIDTITNGKYKEQIAQINAGMMGVVTGAEGGTLSILGSAQVAQSVQRLAVEMEQERQRMAAVESLFDYGRKINYDQTANQINYQTSSSKESVYNVTNTNNFNVGTIIGKDFQMRELSNAMAPFIDRALKNLGSAIK